MKSFLTILLSATLTAAAQTERYIITYDDKAWKGLQQQTGAFSTASIKSAQYLNELKMQVADLEATDVKRLDAIPGVKLFKDTEVHISAYTIKQPNPPNWGLDRIDQHSLPLDSLYRYDSRGFGVDVWVIDTGVQVNHNEFGGRATFDINFAGDGINTDCNGHGTHVSSTIGGTNVGVAKGVKIHGVKVLDCSGSGFASGIIAAINWVITKHISLGKKSVINMSLGGGKYVPINQAVDAASQAGITVVVAAGNEAQDACNVSPASATTAIAVAASDKNDMNAGFSNWGTCVSLYAPGVSIYGAYKGAPNTYAILSGTSMASPHVAGTAALILASGFATTPSEVRSYLTSHGTPNVIQGGQASTPNILLYSWQ